MAVIVTRNKYYSSFIVACICTNHVHTLVLVRRSVKIVYYSHFMVTLVGYRVNFLSCSEIHMKLDDKEVFGYQKCYPNCPEIL